MNKLDVIAYFDRLAPDWDRRQTQNEKKIGKILDYAGITDNVSVLDVACGTGVLFPAYLDRNIKSVTGVDISLGMISVARSKFSDPRIKLIHGDIEEINFPEPFDRCVVYNALPHFPDPRRLIRRLSEMLAEGGRLTVAHGLSRAQIDQCHSASAAKVSVRLMSETELAAIFESCFDVDITISNDDMYVVSGVKRKESGGQSAYTPQRS